MEQQDIQNSNTQPSQTGSGIEERLNGYRTASITAIVLSILSMAYWTVMAFLYFSDAGLGNYEWLGKIVFAVMFIFPEIIKLIAGILGVNVKKNPGLVKGSWILYIIGCIIKIIEDLYVLFSDASAAFGMISKLLIFATLVYIYLIYEGYKINKWLKKEKAAAKQESRLRNNAEMDPAYAKIEKKMKRYHTISIIAVVLSVFSLLFSALLFIIPTGFSRILLILSFFALAIPAIIKLLAAIWGLEVKKNPASIKKSWIMYMIYMGLILILNVLRLISVIRENSFEIDIELCLRIIALLMYAFEIYTGYQINKWVKTELPKRSGTGEPIPGWAADNPWEPGSGSSELPDTGMGEEQGGME